jgi:hypothetical protein
MGFGVRSIAALAKFWFRSQVGGICLAVVSFVFAGPVTARAEGDAKTRSILYAASGTGGTEGVLYTVDPGTGAILTTVAPLHDVNGNSYGVSGLKYDPANGIVYGATGPASPTFPNYFVTVDPATALVTPIGPLGVVLTDIAIDPGTGTVYGLAEFDQDFFTVDTSTGEAVRIGSTGIDLITQGGLAANRRGALFGVTSFSFYRFNRKTGTATFIGPTGLRNLIKAADFSPKGVMYGLEGGGGSDYSHLRWLVTFDLATGSATRVGQITVNDLGSLAFVPQK